MAGCFENLQAEVREVESIAVLRRLEGVLRLRARAEVDGGAAAVAEFEVAGDEVGVKVGEEDVADFEPELRGVGEVLVDVALRVDDDGRGSGFVADEVRSVRETAEVILFENQERLLFLDELDAAVVGAAVGSVVRSDGAGGAEAVGGEARGIDGELRDEYGLHRLGAALR